jgi:hypothetical protein
MPPSIEDIVDLSGGKRLLARRIRHEGQVPVRFFLRKRDFRDQTPQELICRTALFLDLLLERDMAGLHGALDMGESEFTKIDTCHVFVGNASFIHDSDPVRKICFQRVILSACYPLLIQNPREQAILFRRFLRRAVPDCIIHRGEETTTMPTFELAARQADTSGRPDEEAFAVEIVTETKEAETAVGLRADSPLTRAYGKRRGIVASAHRRSLGHMPAFLAWISWQERK